MTSEAHSIAESEMLRIKVYWYETRYRFSQVVFKCTQKTMPLKIYLEMRRKKRQNYFGVLDDKNILFMLDN